MGQKIVNIFESVLNESCLATRMRLCLMVGIPSNKAAEIEDSPENIKKITAAYKEVMGKEYGG